MANYIDQVIMLLAGAYATGVGFGWLASPARGPAGASWQQKFGPMLRIVGPLLVLISGVLTVAGMAG